MSRGDQIYVMRPLLNMEGVYEHHGIDCGDGTVIHYSKASATPTVSRTSSTTFAWGNPVYTKQYSVSFIADVVVERAASRLGEQQYNLLSNNCEHFATWCKTGRNESRQLAEYGLDVRLANLGSSRRLIEEAAQSGNPVEAMQLFDQALTHVAIAQAQLQTQYNQAQKDAHTWHQVAQLALKQNKEPVARAALERKVGYKRQAEDYAIKLQQLAETAESLDRNAAGLHQTVARSSNVIP